ncbi:hypothetical protein HMPREF1548_01174 [Clostridium sp. KLE 1755]|nr:hypothetical protein HMPREF1548_01174 [Clostridium sp. KLE 1755]
MKLGQDNECIRFEDGLPWSRMEKSMLKRNSKSFRKRLVAEYLMEANEYISAIASPTAEHLVNLIYFIKINL